MSFPLASLANDDMQCLDLLKSFGSLWDLSAMCYSLLLNNTSNKQERQCIPLVCYSISSNLKHIFICEILHWETTIDSYLMVIPIYNIQQKWKTCEAYAILVLAH